MSDKITNIVKATAVGAAFGVVAGVACMPGMSAKKKSSNAFTSTIGNMLDVAGTALRNFADMLEK